MSDFSDKIILITGGAKNLGAATAQAFAELGAKVIVNYRQSHPTRELIKKVDAIFQADVTSEKDVQRLEDFIKKKYSRLDVLINNVGGFLYKPIVKTTPQEFLQILENNIISTHLATASLLPLLKKSRAPVIINIASAGAGEMATPEKTTPYYIAKTGVLMLTKLYARELAKHKIRVNAVSPGILQSSVVNGRPTPLGRYAKFSDVTRAILWLSDPRNEYITGANVEVSGGWRPEAGR